MSIDLDFRGAVAVVTGAASGIGAATARHLADAGAAVAVADINADAGHKVVASIRDAGGRASWVHMDVARQDAVETAFVQIREEFGAPTVLVNNAFAARVGPFLDAGPADIALTFDVIVHGTFNTCRAVVPDMLAAGAGSIVNVLSEAGRIGEEGMSIYAAAKAGVGGFTKSLARELGPAGVRVNAVSPGTTRTPAVTTVVDDDRQEKMARRYPLRRLGEPEDIADGILYLASDRARWVTGQTLSVSGGWSMV